MTLNEVAVGAIMQNEFPYLLEWGVHRLDQGFGRVSLVDNGSFEGAAWQAQFRQA
jgi:hypothetical protein